MKQIIVSIFLTLLLLGVGFFTLKAYENANSYEAMAQILAHKQNAEELSITQLKKLADALTLGLYEGYDESVEEQRKLMETGEYFKKRALSFTLYTVMTLFLLLGLSFLASRRTQTLFITLAALIVLTGGLLMPIMMMSIHMHMEYLGDVVLMTESKGVAGSIGKLFEGEEYVVGGALLLFSILLPLVKTLGMIFVAIFSQSRWSEGIIRFFKALGKWSMADVFVVATFLVYFSGSKGGASQAEVQAGFYFFLAYVILSILSSLSAEKILTERESSGNASDL